MEQVKLNNNNKMDQIGIGVYQVLSKNIDSMLKTAFNEGYRSIDTANLYLNEVAVGQTMKNSGLKREEIFLTSKIWPSDYGSDKTIKAVEDTLKRLDTDYLDLLFLHQPFGDYVAAWKVLETYVEKGIIKNIGISNFNVERTEDLISQTKILPAVAQVECHPYYQQKDLKQLLSKYNIKLEAWYPLGHANKGLLQEKVFSGYAQKYGKSAAQIILKWHLQEGHIIIPKSLNPLHIKENIELYDFELNPEEMRVIRSLDKNKPFFNIPDFIFGFIIKLMRIDCSKQR